MFMLHVYGVLLELTFAILYHIHPTSFALHMFIHRLRANHAR